MVSGRRGISKCTAAVTSNLRLSSQEPLLFLYPAWARAITSQAAPIITNDAYPFLGEDRRANAPATPQHSEPIEMRRADRPPNSTPAKAAKATEDDGPPKDRIQLAYERYKAKKLYGSDTRGQISPREKASLRHHGSAHEPPLRKMVSDSSADEPLPRRVVSGIKINRILTNCKQLSWKEDMEHSTRDEYFVERRMKREEETYFPVDVVQPRDILEDLIENTIPRTSGTVIQMLVPDAALPELLFGMEDNIMEIKHRTGADIDLLEEEEEDVRGMGILSISGSSDCVLRAAAIILTETPGSIMKALPHPSTLTGSQSMKFKKSNGGIQRRSLVNFSEGRSMPKPRRADAVPRPEAWTAKSLHEYVLSLTRMPMPSYMHRLLYEPGEEHQMVVAELLDGIFDAEECLQVMALSTINEGISYFTKKNQMHFVRDIYFKVRLRGMKLDTETFNIMLRNAAKVEDFDTFSHLLKSMIESLYRPNAGTWLAFLPMLKSSPKLMNTVVGEMDKLGLFHEVGVQSKVCAIVSPYRLQAALSRDPPTSFLGFAHSQERIFTKAWLTLSGANKLLHVLGSRGLISECWLLIDYMVERGIKPDVISCNTILDAACKHSGFIVGIDVLEPLMKDYGFRPDGVTWAILSKRVWEAQYYATARVIWRYGCLQGWISHPMRHRVANSLKKRLLLLHSTEPASDKELESWAHNAGAFVVTGHSAQFAENIATPITPTAKSRLEESAFATVKNDADLFLKYEPVDKPVPLIKQALAVDLGAAERPDEPFSERMKWLDEHVPTVAKTKRRLSPSAYQKLVQMPASANPPQTDPEASQNALEVTLRMWRWRQQKSQERAEKDRARKPQVAQARGRGTGFTADEHQEDASE